MDVDAGSGGAEVYAGVLVRRIVGGGVGPGLVGSGPIRVWASWILLMSH